MNDSHVGLNGADWDRMLKELEWDNLGQLNGPTARNTQSAGDVQPLHDQDDWAAPFFENHGAASEANRGDRR